MIVKNTSASISIGNNEAKQLESETDLEICKKCDKFRFKRAHHCSVCKACVDKMDHHCFILNNCIGQKNYNYFISYLFLVTELSLFISILCSLNIVFFMRDASVTKNILMIVFSFPLRAVLVWILGSITFFMVGYFFMTHLQLILYEKTSLESKYKIVIDKEKEEEIKNMKIKEKFKLIYKNLLIVVKGDSILDLFWPD